MAIIIKNIDPAADDEESTYKLSINLDEITVFKHKRKDGLAECLRKAAKAVENQNRTIVPK